MKLFLLRHGQAGSGYPDSVREFTERGRAHATALGQFLKGNKHFHPEVLWQSPLVRAQQTAACVLSASDVSVDQVREVDRLEPDRDPVSLLQELEGLQRDLLIVGHNPNISVFASLLLGGERGRARVYFKTCNMVCLEWAPIPNYGQVGSCELAWMLDPRLF